MGGSMQRSEPGDHPSDGKEDKNGVACFLVSRVSEHLRQLEKVVRAVVHDQHQGPDAVRVGCPAEHHQGDRCVVVDEHLPKILSPHVKKLAETSKEFKNGSF